MVGTFITSSASTYTPFHSQHAQRSHLYLKFVNFSYSLSTNISLIIIIIISFISLNKIYLFLYSHRLFLSKFLNYSNEQLGKLEI